MNTRSPSSRNAKAGTFVAVTPFHFTLKLLAAAILFAGAGSAYALPVGGAVSAGSATIGSGAGTTTITQTSQNAAINWQSFNIGTGESVNFVQPNGSATALNRVLGADPSSILGSLNANGKVFLVNPNGIVFGQGASVNVGGLVGSTRDISDSDFMAGKYNFEGTGAGSVVNHGSINANGGSVALLGANVSNQGVIQAQLGTVALAAGNAFTLDVAGDGLLNVAVNKGAVDALVQNGGLIQADGGRVLMTAQSANNLLQSSVNNTGVVRAQTIENRNGSIMLMGDMQSGTVSVGGTLDASAPNGGSGGFVETSAAHVNIAQGSKVTTLASNGKTGTWLIDPVDFVISSSGDISGTKLSNELTTSNITIQNLAGAGNGDIRVEEPVTWTAPTTLTLSATRDIEVKAAITTTGGDLKLIAGRDVTQNAAISATADGGGGGNVAMVAGRNVTLNQVLTVTNGNALFVGANDGTGLGTIKFGPGIKSVVTGSLSTVKIYYAPTSYTTPTIFSDYFTLTGGAKLTPFMWIYLQADDKVYDGKLAAHLSLKANPAGVEALGGTATFNTANVGTGKTVTYSSYSLGGASSNLFALFAPFDSLTAIASTPGSGITLANITPALLTITANDATKTKGNLLVIPSSAFTTSKMVNSETIGGVTLTSPGTVASAPVTTVDNPYLITPSNATGGTFDPANYTINYVQGNLRVTAAAPVITPPVVTPPVTTPPVTTPPVTTPPVTTPPVTTPADPTDPTDPGTTPPVTTVPGSTPSDPTPTDPTSPGSTPTDPASASPGSTSPGSTSPVTTVPGSTPTDPTSPVSTSPVSTPVDPTSPGSTTPVTGIPGLPLASTPPGLPVQQYPGAKTPDIGNSGEPGRPSANSSPHDGRLNHASPNPGNAYLPLLPALAVVGTGVNVPGNQLAQVTPILPIPVKAPERASVNGLENESAHQVPYLYKAPLYLPKQERN
ncbi:MAG TPA: filamentous hemagglutinin N-terminal domain-containing protein [Pseudomonas sp.]|jgi:filamentous hemagglutinin family protein|uniref:two-partner secretion domain-containing protein n=1 Tax=Pseudomonas sp. TaxID=306 RepID=UPI002EDA0D0E